MAEYVYAGPITGWSDIPNPPIQRTRFYEDHNSGLIRTLHQDEEIAKLKKELDKAKCAEKNKVKDLIAYYYKQ